MSQLTQDFRFAVRNLRKQPGLALAAILTLALGIGVNSGIFSIVDSVLLTPPPFRDPEQLMIVWASNPELGDTEGLGIKGPAADAVFYDWQRESRSFERLGMLQSDRKPLTGQGEPEQLSVVRVTGDFFSVLGTPPAIGRTISPADDTLGKPTVVVLSHSLWQRRFNSDRGVVGRTITLGGEPYTVIGVMPPRFTFPRGGFDVPGAYGFPMQTDLWMPTALSAEARAVRTSRYDVVIGRLKPGVSMESADAEMKALSERLATTYPDTDHGWSAYLQPLLDQMRGGLRTALAVLWGAAGFVLLIACANVANLLLARAASRQKEIAVRMAMGAGRRRLISQLLTESAVLCLLGGALGVALAWAGLRIFSAFVPTGLVEAWSFDLSGRAVAFTAALCILATVLAGLVPALQMSRPDFAGSLREGTRAGAGTAGSRRTRSTLVVAEVALAVLLLVGAGLLLRSFVHLLNVDPGFQPDRILTFELGMPSDRYPQPERLPFLERVLDRVKALPGVDSAAIISDLPMDNNGGFVPFNIEGKPVPEQALAQSALLRSVSPGYFEIMEIPLRGGRYLSAQDAPGTMPATVIDESMAKSFWPGEDAVGKRIRLGKSQTWITVVGVVGSVREAGLQGDVQPQLYLNAAQNPIVVQFLMRIVVRAKEGQDPESLVAGVRQAVHEVDPNQPVSRIRTLEEMVSGSVAKPRFSLLLLGLFALLALILSIVGIYGITSYSVAQRTRELGLRMALGAQPQGILRMIVGETGTLAIVGVVLGLAAAFALTRVMATLLFGVGATDPLTYVGVSVLLILICLIAAYLPGRRATRVEPIVALRTD